MIEDFRVWISKLFGGKEAEKGRTTELNSINDETEVKLNKLAEKIKQYGMETPAVLFLEAGKPLSVIVGEFAVAFLPIFSGFFGQSDLTEYATILENRNNIERLIQKILNN